MRSPVARHFNTLAGTAIGRPLACDINNWEGDHVKKVLLMVTATAFLGTSTLVPTPASAVFFLLPLVLTAKKDPNFKAVNPYANKKVAKHTKKTKKKM